MMAAFSVWALKFLALSSLFALTYGLFARLRPVAAERFLFAKILLFASPVLALVTVRDHVASVVATVGPASLPPATIAQASSLGAAVASRSGGWLATALIGAYAVVAGLLVFRLLWSLWRMEKVARSGRPAGDWRGIPILHHDLAVPPATFGLFRSRIFLPKTLAATLSPRDLEVICAHEATHVARGDFRWKVLARLLACFAYFSPLWLYLLRRFEDELELSCDDLVRGDAEVSSKEYAGLLVRLAETVESAPFVPICSVSSAFGPTIIRRISAMKRDVMKSRRSVVFGSAFALFAAAVPIVLVANPVSQAASADDKALDPAEGFHLSVNAQVKGGRGNEFQLKTSRVVRPGKLIVLGGDTKVSIGFQYEIVGEDLEVTWSILDADQQSMGGSRVTIPRNGGADVEGTFADPQNASGKQDWYSIEFWDVTRKRAESAAKTQTP